jgi:hypothetical protein
MSQIIRDIERELLLFVLVAHLLDGLAADQVLGNFRPRIGGAASGALAAALVLDDRNAQPPLLFHGRRRQAARARPLLAVRDELCPAHARVLLPRHLGRGAARAVHAHALRPGGNVDDGPVAGGAVAGLAHAAA